MFRRVQTALEPDQGSLPSLLYLIRANNVLLQRGFGKGVTSEGHRLGSHITGPHLAFPFLKQTSAFLRLWFLTRNTNKMSSDTWLALSRTATIVGALSSSTAWTCVQLRAP